MASKERSNKRRVGIDAEVTPLQLCWLRGEPLPKTFEAHVLKYDTFGTNKELWQTHRETVIAEHVAEFPGTRPDRWWQYDSPRSPKGTYPGCSYDSQLPEPRKRLGGIGTPDFEVLNYKPVFAYGLPVSWIDQSDVDYYSGTMRHVVTGQLVNPKPSGGKFTGVAIDPNDPPVYESESSYLDRLGLFLPGEKKRVKAADFEPETLAYID
jgi:hypothetical protein